MMHTVPAEGASTNGRLCSFGIISDIQYANIPDGFSFKGTRRYYRWNSLRPSAASTTCRWHRNSCLSHTCPLPCHNRTASVLSQACNHLSRATLTSEV